MSEPEESSRVSGEEFSQLLVANYQRIYGFVYSLVYDHSATDDIMQEASKVLWRKFDQFEQGTDFAAWAMSVARFCVFEWRRRQEKVPFPMADDDLMHLADEAITINLDGDARREALRTCISELPDRHAGLLKERYFQGTSVASIAKRQERTPRAVYKMLSRVHELLLVCIRGKLADEGLT